MFQLSLLKTLIKESPYKNRVNDFLFFSYIQYILYNKEYICFIDFSILYIVFLIEIP